MTKALQQLLEEGYTVDMRALSTLSPYRTEHNNRFGNYVINPNRQCHRKGLRMPNFRTVKRRVDEIDAKEHLRKRAGANAANDRFRPTRVLSTTDLLSLERVQIDHTRVDVIVVDEGDRLPIGRPG
jgi:putative transposase